MPTDRPNHTLAAVVDHALTIADVRAAAAYMADHGAGFALTCRVLVEPARRRPGAMTEVQAAPPPRGRPPFA